MSLNAKTASDKATGQYVSRDATRTIRLRVLATDLLLAPNLPGAKGKFLVHWQPYFFPKAFAKAKE